MVCLFQGFSLGLSVYFGFFSGFSLWSPGLLEHRALRSSGLVWLRKNSHCTPFKVGIDVVELRFEFDISTISISAGQFCCRKEITYFKDFKTFSLQPKLILLALSLLFLLGILYFYITAKRKTKSHKIPRLRQTLITLKEHSILLSIFLVILLMDQSVTGYIEFGYSKLGPSGAFWIWWAQTFLGYFVTSIVLPALCLRFEKLLKGRSGPPSTRKMYVKISAFLDMRISKYA